MKVIATTFAASAVAVQIGTQTGTKPLAAPKDWSELPEQAEEYAKLAVQVVCSGANLGEQPACFEWAGPMMESIKDMMSQPECPATDFDAAACAQCTDSKSETTSKYWPSLKKSEKEWLNQYLSRNAMKGQMAYDLTKVTEESDAAIQQAEAEGAADYEGRTKTMSFSMNRGGNTADDSMEEYTLYKVQPEHYICVLRMTAADGCGKTQKPSCGRP